MRAGAAKKNAHKKYTNDLASQNNYFFLFFKICLNGFGAFTFRGLTPPPGPRNWRRMTVKEQKRKRNNFPARVLGPDEHSISRRERWFWRISPRAAPPRPSPSSLNRLFMQAEGGGNGGICCQGHSPFGGGRKGSNQRGKKRLVDELRGMAFPLSLLRAHWIMVWFDKFIAVENSEGQKSFRSCPPFTSFCCWCVLVCKMQMFG